MCSQDVLDIENGWGRLNLTFSKLLERAHPTVQLQVFFAWKHKSVCTVCIWTLRFTRAVHIFRSLKNTFKVFFCCGPSTTAARFCVSVYYSDICIYNITTELNFFPKISPKRLCIQIIFLLVVQGKASFIYMQRNVLHIIKGSIFWKHLKIKSAVGGGQH